MKNTDRKPAMVRQTMQKWMVGTRVRVTKRRESGLRDVPSHRLTSTGTIKAAELRFPRTPSMRAVSYIIALDSDILGASEACVIPGADSFYVNLI